MVSMLIKRILLPASYTKTYGKACLLHTKFHCNNMLSLGDINRKTLKQRHLDVRFLGVAYACQSRQKWIRVGHSGS